jgi:hypothetical protein
VPVNFASEMLDRLFGGLVHDLACGALAEIAQSDAPGLGDAPLFRTELVGGVAHVAGQLLEVFALGLLLIEVIPDIIRRLADRIAPAERARFLAKTGAFLLELVDLRRHRVGRRKRRQ